LLETEGAASEAIFIAGLLEALEPIAFEPEDLLASDLIMFKF
jgi:hypothetical protein